MSYLASKSYGGLVLEVSQWNNYVMCVRGRYTLGVETIIVDFFFALTMFSLGTV